MSEIKTIAIEDYHINYTADILQIGCERHPITEWWGFDDGRISAMATYSFDFWEKWKSFIQQAIELSPATPTGHEEKESV